MKREDVVKTVEELVAAHSCNGDLKALAQEWLQAEGSAKQKELSVKLVNSAEADIMPIDDLIAFTASEKGVQLFGADLAKKIHDHGVDIKSKGATHCDCPACAACATIVAHKEDYLA